MSYQGGPPHGNGYWTGHGPPDAYSRQDARPQVLPAAPTGPNAHPQQYQPAPTNDGQFWNQNGQIQYDMGSSYGNNGFYPPAPPQPQYQQVQQPQYISPAQLLQQPTALPPFEKHTPQISSVKKPSGQVFKNSQRLAVPPSADSQPDTAMLLISLAEEYFDAAHDLAPTAAFSMTATDVEAYSQLIATGLGCLDTALKRVRLPPRTEAIIRLRYSGVLFEETENSMEAETALSKGIALCERNHYYDLKYAMQFLLAQFMAKKNPKASMKALDGHISEAQTYQHFSWVYAFRFLRASHALESGNITDNHAAISNLRAIATLASQQDDRAIHLAASLMEAMAYLRNPGPEAVEHVQRAIAAAWGYQMDPSCRIPQLVGLAHILDVACAIRQGNSQVMLTKLKDMQNMMDETLKDSSWSTTSDIIAIPINRTPKSSQTVSQDTRMILGIGNDGGDNLMMTFLNKKDTYSITYLLCGMVLLHKNSGDPKGMKYLKAGLDSLEAEARISKKPTGLLPDLVSKHLWRGQILCYFRIYMAFCSAGISEWAKVKQHIDQLRSTAKTYEISLDGPLGCLMMYLTGVYHQGIGDLDAALEIFQNERFNLPQVKNTSMTSADQVERDIALLAALNSLWILQEGQRQNPANNNALIERLEPFCVNHPNVDIQVAFNLIVVTVNTNPPAQIYKIKSVLNAALQGAKNTANTLFLCITLSVMCSRFFSNVVGAQAEKSAMAACVQAKNSGNILWRSVAEGMLAKCYEVQGKKIEAQSTLEQARVFAQQALPDV